MRGAIGELLAGDEESGLMLFSACSRIGVDGPASRP
jgi:hypothetical protein